MGVCGLCPWVLTAFFFLHRISCVCLLCLCLYYSMCFALQFCAGVVSLQGLGGGQGKDLTLAVCALYELHTGLPMCGFEWNLRARRGSESISFTSAFYRWEPGWGPERDEQYAPGHRAEPANLGLKCPAFVTELGAALEGEGACP